LKKILLVGCGNIGSRHLQGLVKIKDSVEIIVIDPSNEAQNLAKERLNEIQYNTSQFQIIWKNSIDGIKESDLVIIATPSKGRKNLIKNLLSLGHLRFLIEKMVCQSDAEYEEILEQLSEHNAKVWINATRRYFKSYKLIKELFVNSDTIHLSVKAGNMGLGSNAIHFVDLFSWLTNNNKIKLNGDFLTDEIFPSKRGKNYFEFAGLITGSNPTGSFLSINFLPHDDMPLTVRIYDKNNDLIIDEINENITKNRGFKNKELEFKTEFQSNLTGNMISDIFLDDDCNLPSIEEQHIAHKELFRIFNNHIEKITKERKDLCPIT